MFSKIKETVWEFLAKFKRQGSNRRFRSVLSLNFHTLKYEPHGSSSYIPLPDYLATKKAIINLKNEDNECFKWAITRALNPVKRNAERIDRKLENKIKYLQLGGSEVSSQFDCYRYI